MKGINKFLLLLLFITTIACQKRTLTPAELVKWVKNADNALLRKKTIGGLQLEALYCPVPYIIANELKSNHLPKAVYQKRAKVLSKLQQYQLQLAVTEREATTVVNWMIADNSASEKRLNYLSFGMQQHIYLVEGNDTLPCVSYHFERSYDAAPHRTFLVGFDNKNTTGDKVLVFDSPEFHTGPIKIRFKEDAINNIPSIKLQP